MFTLPPRFAPLIVAFAPLFRQRTWRWAEQLLIGVLLAPGVRTVTSVLRGMGLATERQFGKYHRVLSRAVWSSRTASRILLLMLVRTFVSVLERRGDTSPPGDYSVAMRGIRGARERTTQGDGQRRSRHPLLVAGRLVGGGDRRRALRRPRGLLVCLPRPGQKRVDVLDLGVGEPDNG
ncbi:MAG TPA: transposase [Gemmatimonadaceae bacterium]|jgi:hypothetical protein|nr:transposase [Gemmatimonadaceae bacterium]